MKTKLFYPMFLVAVLVSSCNLFEAGKQNSVPVSVRTIDSLLLIKRSEAVKLSIVLVDDISGSYTLRPESRDIDILLKLFKARNGRKLLGYTTITEDSYTPIVRLSYLDNPEPEGSNPNMWIDKQVKEYYTRQYLKQVVDSLNDVEVSKFNQNVIKKLDRPVAKRSDVVLALQRAYMFLKETSTADKVLIVCSDFKDTYGRTLNLDARVKLFIVGNANPSDIKKCTGRDIGSYAMFESYEEAFNKTVQLYNK